MLFKRLLFPFEIDYNFKSSRSNTYINILNCEVNRQHTKGYFFCFPSYYFLVLFKL